MRTRVWLVLWLTFLCSLVSISVGAQPTRGHGIDSFRYPDDLTTEHRFQDYTVRIYRKPIGDGAAEILKEGRRIWCDAGNPVYSTGQIDDVNPPGRSARLMGNKSGAYVVTTLEPELADVGIGTDITGDGIPNLVISYWTGGASCCFDYYIFDLGRAFRLLAQLEGHEGPCGFIDLDNDSVPEFATIDTSNRYWRDECHACQPRPRVVLRYRDGAYRLAPELMRRQPPAIEEVNSAAQRICDHRRADSAGWDLATYGEFGGYFSDLLYTGNPEVARRYLQWAHCDDQTEIAQFLEQYSEELKKSKYWPELSKLIGDLL